MIDKYSKKNMAKNNIPKLKRSKKLLLLVFFIVIFISFIISLYFYLQYAEAKKLLDNPQAVTNANTKALVAKVGNLMLLPSETPTVAVVTDINKLYGQPFFTKAQNGDQVLIFTKNKLAILYRPSINKIIEVSPVSIGSNNTPTPTISPSAPKKTE